MSVRERVYKVLEFISSGGMVLLKKPKPEKVDVSKLWQALTEPSHVRRDDSEDR